MADVFISYSKADRLLVEQLAAYLESEGWSVWWDRSLTAGETWRDEIARELAKARVALVVWTQDSIKSDFVRAEAGRAKADAKLIPVKAAGVEYRDIPLPFGEMHTEPLENRELVRAAILTQLAKPQVVATGIWAATASIRYAVLTWIGIIGLMITLFSNLRGILELAEWARLLVQHWADWMHTAWSWTLAWFGIKLPPIWAPYLSFTGFAASTIAGGKLSALLSTRGSSSNDHSVEVRNFRISNPWIALMGSVVVTIGWIAFLLGSSGVSHSVFGTSFGMWDPLIETGIAFLIPMAVFVLFYSSRDHGQAVLSVLLVVPLAYALLFVPVYGPGANFGFDVLDPFIIMADIVLLSGLIPVALTQIPARALNRRLLFIVVGLGILLGLNELSKLNLGQFLPSG
jgi:TIR domain